MSRILYIKSQFEHIKLSNYQNELKKMRACQGYRS